MSADTPQKNKNKAPRYALNEKIGKISNTAKGIFFIVLSAFCFSLMSLFVRLSGNLPVFQKAMFRNGIAMIVAFFALLKSGSFKMQKGSLPGLLLRSVFGAIGVVGNFYAIDRMNIADASILNKLAPFFSVACSAILLKEKASKTDWLLIALAFFGAIFVVKPSFDFSQTLPALVGVIGGLSAGVAYTYVHYLGKKGERTAFIVFFFSAFSTLTMLPMAIIQFQPMQLWQIGVLLLAGAAASGAQFSLTAAYSYAPAKEISVFDYSQVLFTALWGFFLLEFPDLFSVIGYVIIITAAALKTFFARKNKAKQNEPKKDAPTSQTPQIPLDSTQK